MKSNQAYRRQIQAHNNICIVNGTIADAILEQLTNHHPVNGGGRSPCPLYGALVPRYRDTLRATRSQGM